MGPHGLATSLTPHHREGGPRDRADASGGGYAKVLKLILLTGLALAVLAPAAIVRAQRASIDQNIFLDLLPGLKTAPAPAWLRPGTRITYLSAAASIAAERAKLVEDPYGDWEVTYPDGSKKRFREEDISGTGQAGAGHTVLSVVYLDRSVAVMEFRSYASLTYGGPSFLARLAGAVGIPGAGSDFWMHPAVLAQAPGLHLGTELTVLRMGYALHGRQYRVIRFQGKSSSWNYEETSGILFRSSATAETTVMVPPTGTSGPVTQRVGGTLIAQNTFMDVRTPPIPWAQAPAPSWFADARRVVYDGTFTLYVPGSPALSAPLRVTFDRQQFGGQWARYIQHEEMPNVRGLPPMESTTTRVFGPAQIGGLWVPPDVQKQLRPGQVLDRDPATGIVATVSGESGGGFGISESNDLHRIDYLYDTRNGILVFARTTNRSLNIVIEWRLLGVQ